MYLFQVYVIALLLWGAWCADQLSIKCDKAGEALNGWVISFWFFAVVTSIILGINILIKLGEG